MIALAEVDAGDNLFACLSCCISNKGGKLNSNEYDNFTITASGTGGMPPIDNPDEADAMLLYVMTPGAHMGDM